MTPFQKKFPNVTKDTMFVVSTETGHRHFRVGDMIRVLRDVRGDKFVWVRVEQDCSNQYHGFMNINDIELYDGWIDHTGGEMPVTKGTLVDVEYRDGRIEVGIPAGCKCSEFSKYGTFVTPSLSTAFEWNTLTCTRIL